MSLIPMRGYSLRYAKTDLGRIFGEKYAGKHFCERRFPNQGIDMGPVIVPQLPCCALPPPKAFPLGGRLWGEGAPVRTLGRMRGRSIGPTGREKKSVGAIGPSFYKERLGQDRPLISHLR